MKFAEGLLANGVNVWVDQWEILPGDSLVSKIFEEGLKNATAVVIVLSQFSVNKPWVKEELNASIVAKLSRQIRIIPVLIDQCVVPGSLSSTVWIKIKDLSSFDEETKAVVAAIFQHREKPALGSPPLYTQVTTAQITGLHIADVKILELIGQIYLSTDHPYIRLSAIQEKTKRLGMAEATVLESLEMLERHHMIEPVRKTMSAIHTYSHVMLTALGFKTHANAFIPGFKDIERAVAMKILNDGADDNTSIVSALKQPMAVIDHILIDFNTKGLITIIRAQRYIKILKSTVALKRTFDA